MHEIAELTKSEHAAVRLFAVQQMKPLNFQTFKFGMENWPRLFELANDEDADVRLQVIMNLCDGSPLLFSNDIYQCLSQMRRDTDDYVRFYASCMLRDFKATGIWKNRKFDM